MNLIIPLNLHPEDSVLNAWNEWDKSRKIFKYSTSDGFGAGTATKVETERTKLEDFESLENQIRALEGDSTKFYSGFKAAQRGQK